MLDIDHHASELGSWQAARRRASAVLRPYVRGYVGTSSHVALPIIERHLPSLDVPLVINLGEPHRRVNGSGEWLTLDGSWVVGPQRAPRLAAATGRRQFMVVRFTPIGAYLFLKTPMYRLVDRVLSLEAIDPSLARGVADAVTAAGDDWTGRFDAVETLVASRLAGTLVSPAMAAVWHELMTLHRSVPVGALASLGGCSPRTLTTRFREQVGLSPKTVSRLLRFTRALRLVSRVEGGRRAADLPRPFITAPPARRDAQRRIAWAALAARCGYVDQAHLVREFREFAGSPPAAFLRQISLRS